MNDDIGLDQLDATVALESLPVIVAELFSRLNLASRIKDNPPAAEVVGDLGSHVCLARLGTGVVEVSRGVPTMRGVHTEPATKVEDIVPSGLAGGKLLVCEVSALALPRGARFRCSSARCFTGQHCPR